MRLWHKDLISVLPHMQLLGQWRECCAIARNISVNGTPNHVLVNKIMDYPMSHFLRYSREIYNEMLNRGYSCNWNKLAQNLNVNGFRYCFTIDDIYQDWHNDRYLRQCLYNLEEKAMCGAIPKEEWKVITDIYGEKYDLYCG